MVRIPNRVTRWTTLALAGLLIGLIGAGLAEAQDKKKGKKKEGAPAPAAEGAVIEVGKKAPPFALKDQDDQTVKLEDYKGKWVVLYFYPKDDTPGCTVQACDFTDQLADFQKLDAVVLGCSTDSTESHRAFIKKHELKITLLSDPQRKVMTPYGGTANGRTVRSTVIIDPKGMVAAHYPRVVPAGHADELKARLAELRKS